MKKKILLTSISLMMILSYFTVLPQLVFAEEIENKSIETSEEEVGFSENQKQQLDEEFSIPTLKKNQKKEVNEEKTFEIEEDSIEDVRIGPLSLEETRSVRASNSIRYTPIHVPIGANKEMQEKVFKQGSVVYFGDEEVRHEELDFFNYKNIPNSTKIDLREEKLVTNSGIYDGIEITSNQLAYSSRYTFGNYMGNLRDYKYVTNYGETVEITYPINSNSTLAFTLHEREGNSYSGAVNRPSGHFLSVNNPGRNDSDNEIYDSSRPNEELMIIEIYESEKKISLGYDPVTSMSVKGDTRKSDIMNFFNHSKTYEDNNILRIYSKDHGNIKKYEYNKGDKPKGPSNVSGYNDDDNIFFVFNKGEIKKASSSIKIAPDKKLEVNKNRRVAKGTDLATMNRTIDEFFTNNEKYSITAADMNYVEAPETNELGKQTVDITVLEYDEKTDKKWKQTYTVPYEVVSDSGPQLSTRERTIGLNTTETELDESIEESFEESSLNNVEYERMEFVKYPDTKKTGIQTGKIKVINEKSVQGNYVDRTYDVDFNVIESMPQMQTKSRDVELDMTKKELDESIKESFEESSLNNIEYERMEFVTYPDTSKTGKQYGEIKVINEKNSQGKYADHIYEVEFNVIEYVGELKVETQIADLPLGTDVNRINSDDYVKSVYYDDKKLDPSEYIVGFKNRPSAKRIGTDNFEVEVKLAKKESIATTESASANIVWGNTLLARDTEASVNPVIMSLSLVEEFGNPKIRMTHGDGPNTKILSKNKLNIYRGNENKVILDYESVGKNEYTDFVISELQPKLDRADIRYGDVIKQNPMTWKNVSLNGRGTFNAKDNQLVNETEGYDDSYYEITKDGYNLLKLNQIAVNNDLVELSVGDTSEQIKEVINFPDSISQADKDKYRFELTKLDTSKPGQGTTQLNIYEKLVTGDNREFMISKEIDYIVTEEPILVELQEVEIPVGTKLEFLDPNSYVKKVVKNGKELNTSEYTASFEKAPTTSKVGKSETTIKIVTKEDNKSIVEKTNTKVLWGDTVGSSLDGTSKTPIDASISMLHDQKKPYLVANEGTGLAINASSGTYINVYQNSEDNAGRIFYVNPYYPKGDARKTMEVFNKAFDEQEFNYGDVIVYETRNEEEVGLKLWASRNEELINESVGYNKSFYEMTKDGYRLLKANQLVVNEKLLSVPLKTTHTEMNKKAAETVVFPKEVDAKDFRFEFASVDTASSGKKKTKLNIYEKLASGEEFKTIIDVEYIVNPQLSENFYDEAGKEIKTTKKTNFDFGTSYQPEPENFVSSGNELYMYKGWLKSNEKPGTAAPRSGKPSKVTKEDTVHYIYEKSEKQINMTIPTEMIFGTENGKDVTSKEYEIKNNSDKVKTEVSLNEFKKETSEVKLLTSKEKDPTKITQSARLNLTTNGKTAVGSLNDTTKNETITTLNPGEKASMGISGNYFGSQKESARIRYNMMFKFTVIPE